jgi:hypothetical protein
MRGLLLLFLVVLFGAGAVRGSLGPAWLSTRKVYGLHTEVLAIASGAYPTVRIEAGERGTRLSVSPRWDLTRTSVGYMGASQLYTTSRTLSTSDGVELFKLGSIEVLLPVAMADAPTPASPCDASTCTAARRTRQTRTEAWLDMSASSSLWHHWTSWSIGPARMVLGVHRPHADRRRHELLGNASAGIPVLVHGVPATMRFDFNCDFTYVPHDAYIAILAGHTHVQVCASAGGGAARCFHIATHRDDIDVIRDGRYCSDALVIGRIHAQRFVVGHSLTLDELSVLPLDLIGPPVDSVDQLVWFGVLLALLCLWMLAIYPGACRTVRVQLLTAYTRATLSVTDTSVFSAHNGAVVDSLTLLTTLTAIGVSVVVVWGYQLDELLNIDLPLAYTRTVVWVAVALVIASAAWPSIDCNVNNVQLTVFHMCNSLRICAWLFAALRYDVWLMQMVMVIVSGLVTLRSGELVFYAFLARPRDMDSLLARRRWWWSGYFASMWALAAWLFGGYTLPMLIDTWWATLAYRVEVAVTIGVVVGVWLPAYLVTKETLHRSALQLSLYTSK